MKLAGALLALLLISGTLRARDNTLSRSEQDDGWVLLFDGESRFGWTQEGGALWKVAGGQIIAEAGESGYLRTTSAFADFVLKCDFREKTDGESGIFLRIAKEGHPQETGYKLQIKNSDPAFPTGSLVKHLKAANVQAAPNQWHTYEVEARGDHFSVKLDGKEVANGEAHKSKVGHIGLEFFPGTPIEFKNIKLKPLNLNPIFNGQNLYEWSPVNPAPEPKKKSGLKKLIPGGSGKPAPDWLVQDRSIHFIKGPNQLETKVFYDDFILQLKIRTNAKSKKDHPNGAVCLRGEKGDGSTGYKVQVHNEARGGDPNKPAENATGALNSIQNARKVVSNDNDFFTETIVARGHHIAVWVSGYPVNDFEDTRAEGPDALIQARTVPGTIRLDTDDAGSSLDFKDIVLAQLPKGGGAAAAATTPPAPTVTAPGGTPAGVTPPAPMPGFPGAAQPAGNPHEKEISKLTQQALSTSDPEQQIKIYDRILGLDPNNIVAYNARKDAQDKVDKMKAEATRQEEERQRADAENRTKEERAQANGVAKQEALKQTQSSFLAGDLKAAASNLAVAKRIDPSDPEVQRWDALIGKQARAQRVKTYALYGAGVLVPVGLLALLILTRGKKDAYLEVVHGLEEGKKYNLDQDVVHIGAVEQDGGTKNEIVVHDVEHTISRFHCEVHRHDGKLYIFDCNSANGTYLDGHRVPPGRPVRLKSGARLKLADACTLRLGFEKRKKE